MTKERLLKIVRPSMISLIEMDFDSDVDKDNGCETTEEYCEKMLNASREEIEEIIGMDIEDLRH